MAFLEYSRIAIPDSPESEDDDEERPSSSRPPSIKVPKQQQKKKTSIICGWTFWLFLLVLFTLAGVGFVLLQQDAGHNFLARLSLGDVEADEERDSNYNKDLHKIQQDDSSDYSSSHDSGSSDSNDIADMESTTKEEEDEESSSQDKHYENESKISSSEDGANDISETNNADTSDRDGDTISESIGDDENEETEAAEDSDSNDSSSSISDSVDENKVEADDDSMMFSGDGDEEEGENVSHTESNAQDNQESNNDSAVEEADEDADEDEASAAEEEDGSETEQDVQHAQDANLSGDSSTDGESMEDHTPPEAGVNSYDDESLSEEEIIAALAKRLQPKDLLYEKSEISDLRAHQFLHLHQMKTGGTSLDHYLRCAKDRLRIAKNLTIPYGNIHECSELRYSRCRDDKDPWCKERLVNASFMSYCAPLKDLELFKWSTADDDIRAITVLRHPVDRVWSMYRFQTKSCYSCMNLTDIYDLLDHKRTGTFKQICMKQLLNHETANMLSHSELLPKENAKYQEEPMASDLVNEAVTNMKSFFTAIGLTEELNRTVDLFGQVFPWFQSEVEWSDMTCELTHDNASPQNNHCGPDGTHWELPPHPDEATRKLIEEHNQLDIAVYEAAVQHFWRQIDAVYKEER